MHFNFLDEFLGNIEDNLQDLSSENFVKLKISDLYEEINGEEVYAVLNIDDEAVVEMLQPFTILMHSHLTVISQQIWNSYVPTQSKLSLPEIASKVWRPCFEEIQQLIEKLHTKSMTLHEIDCYFQNIPPQDLESEICNLVDGCSICLNKPASVTWVSQIVVSVNRYRNIYEVQEVAELLLAAKNSLVLSAKFEELNKLKERVSINFSHVMYEI